MKKLLGLSLVAAMALSTNVFAEETAEASEAKFSVSGNMAMSTNYLWRGISYTAGYGAAFAGLDFSNLFDVEGLYFGTWGSGIEEGSEIDFYGGYSMSIGDLGIDVGYIQYVYTQGGDAKYAPIGGSFSGSSYGEMYAALSYADYGVSVYYENDFAGLTPIVDASFGPVDVQVGYYLSMDTDVSNFYFGSLGVNWPCMLDESYSMNATVAYNSGADQTAFNLGYVNGSAVSLTISKEF